VNPPAAAMFSTTVAAVVCVRLTYPAKGFLDELVAAPLLVTVALYVELSVKKLVPFTVFNNKLVCVPVIADDGLPLVFADWVLANVLVGGVNEPAFGVYSAVPLTNLRLVM